MVFPVTTVYVPLPEELGIFENVNAIINLSNKRQLTITCHHKGRYHFDTEDIWPKIFDSSSNPIILSKVIENDVPNTSVFVANFTLYDESYLNGNFYFSFDFLKNDCLYTRYYTNTLIFKLDKEDYVELVDFLISLKLCYL